MFGDDVEKAAVEHAIAVQPQESCGFVVGGKYYPADNIHSDPENHFIIRPASWIEARKHGKIDAIVHSHTGIHGPYPSQNDMEQQIKSGLPWAIVTLKPQPKVQWFGEHILDVPLVGREFIPGIQDCYAIIRAWYWQSKKRKIKEFPRDNEWWSNGGALFAEGFKEAGFYNISADELREGDVILMQIRSKTPNHGGVILGNGLMLHHVNGQLSRREPYGRWLPYATHYLRYKDA